MTDGTNHGDTHIAALPAQKGTSHTDAESMMLLREMVAVSRLDTQLRISDFNKTTTPGEVRAYLLRCAVLADRIADIPDANAALDPECTARQLLDHDRAHAAGRGPVGADDGRWDGDARGYVHQEHATLVRDEHERGYA